MSNKFKQLIKTLGKYLIVAPLVVFFIFFCLFFSGNVYAASETVSVLTDLQKDSNFNISDYPSDYTDYSIKLIQIAETTAKELVVYIYQPSHYKVDLTATKISISYGYSKDGTGLEPKIYPLKLLSTEGVFDKYLVENYTITSDTSRYYNIVSIFRNYNSTADKEKNDGFDFTDIACSVGQQWCAYYLNDSIVYEMNTFKTMQIDTIFEGNVDFQNSITWDNFIGKYDKGQVWFKCFNSPDYVIKHIFDVDLTWKKQYMKYTNYNLKADTDEAIGDVEYIDNITIDDNDVIEYTNSGLIKRTYSWNRILSSEDFIKALNKNKCDISDDALEKVKASEWVITYDITPCTIEYVGGTYVSSYKYHYNIFDSGILRISFLDVLGKFYDLGVVNSLTSPDSISDGSSLAPLLSTLGDFFTKLFQILGILALILVLVFVSNLILPVFKVLEVIWNGIVFVISLPFKLINWIFK